MRRRCVTYLSKRVSMQNSSLCFANIVSSSMCTSTKETWSSIPFFSDYSASTNGRIKNIKTDTVIKTGKPKISELSHLNHDLIHLNKIPVYDNNGKKRSVSVAKLVALAFHYNPETFQSGMEPYHIDFDVSNNEKDNLKLLPIEDVLYPFARNGLEVPVMVTHLESGKCYRFASKKNCMTFFKMTTPDSKLSYVRVDKVMKDSEQLFHGYRFQDTFHLRGRGRYP
eukprot:131868_1